MGVTLSSAGSTAVSSARRLDRWLRPLGWATLVANTVLVVTGGAVRLTGSGLGCPTWPHCREGNFTPHGAYDVHSAIEFGNRMLTFVLVAIAVATLVAAWQSGRRELRRIALFLALGIPAQAVIGGITVLTDLNPWIVSFHLLCSLAMIGLSVLLLHRLSGPRVGPTATRRLQLDCQLPLSVRYDVAEVRNEAREVHADVYKRGVHVGVAALAALAAAGYDEWQIDIERLDKFLQARKRPSDRLPLRQLLKAENGGK